MTDFYSIRMHASSGRSGEGAHRHLSGGERLVPEPEAEIAGAELMRRALQHGASADHVNLTFERVPYGHLRHVRCLDVSNVAMSSAIGARPVAERVLHEAGVSNAAIAVAFDHVLRGRAAGGSPLRGAVLLDARNGDRLDTGGESGVRASHFDYAPGARAEILNTLTATGLGHFRTHEALALATKVLAAGVCAELCWSDDPAYEAGYVSSLDHGYIRFPNFKPSGAVGGRAFFYNGSPNLVNACIHRLKSECILIDAPVVVRDASASEAFLIAASRT